MEILFSRIKRSASATHEFGGVENLKGKKIAMTWAYSLTADTCNICRQAVHVKCFAVLCRGHQFFGTCPVLVLRGNEIMAKKRRIVIALGGNALGNTLPEQMAAVKITAKAIVDLIEEAPVPPARIFLHDILEIFFHHLCLLRRNELANRLGRRLERRVVFIHAHLCNHRSNRHIGNAAV